LFVPYIDKETEYPENFFEINDKDIDEFKKKKMIAALKAKGKQPDPVEEEEFADGDKDEAVDAKKL